MSDVLTSGAFTSGTFTSNVFMSDAFTSGAFGSGAFTSGVGMASGAGVRISLGCGGRSEYVTLPCSSTQRYISASLGAETRTSAPINRTTGAFRSVIVPPDDGPWIGSRWQPRARAPAIELREKIAYLGYRRLPVREEGGGGPRLLGEVVVLALRVEHSRERQAAARVVAKELDGLSQVHLGFWVALELRQQLAEVPVGAPRVRVGLQGAM